MTLPIRKNLKLIIFVLFTGLSIFISGCVGVTVVEKVDSTVVKYDFPADEGSLPQTAYKTYQDRVVANRTLFFKLRESNEFSNLVAATAVAMSNAIESTQPDYESKSTTKAGSNGTIETSGSMIKTKKINAQYIARPSYDKESIYITYVDSLLLFSPNIYQTYKERAPGWKEKIESYLSYYKSNLTERRNTSENIEILNLSQESEDDLSKYTMFALQIGNAPIPNKQFLEQNILLEDFRGNRYKLTDIEVFSTYSLLKFPYQTNPEDPFIRLKIFGVINKDTDFDLTWYKNRPINILLYKGSSNEIVIAGSKVLEITGTFSSYGVKVAQGATRKNDNDTYEWLIYSEKILDNRIGRIFGLFVRDSETSPWKASSSPIFTSEIGKVIVTRTDPNYFTGKKYLLIVTDSHEAFDRYQKEILARH